VARCSTALGDEICRGCGRTFAEVANWVAMSEAEREAVWQRLEAEGCNAAPISDERSGSC
jgi:predicted Fe-S protein YdhL (DUF1289 family)